MHRIGNRRLARGLLALSLLAVVAAAQGKEPQGGGPGGKEEHGGNIVFQVVSKTQKYSVLYSHEKHLGAGCKCDDCHNEDAKKRIFEKKMGANKFRMKDVNEGKFCGTCHQAKPPADVTHGTFAPKGNCTKCHNVRVREEK